MFFLIYGSGVQVPDYMMNPPDNQKFLTRKSSGGHQARKRKKGRKNQIITNNDLGVSRSTCMLLVHPIMHPCSTGHSTTRYAGITKNNLTLTPGDRAPFV
jgi:hypothetical protein